MEAFGINWTYLLVQVGMCFGILLLLVLIVAFVQIKQRSKFLIGLIGFLTAWVAIYFVAFLAIWVSMFIFSINNPSLGFESAFNLYNAVAPINWITFILFGLLLFFYLFHATKTTLLTEQKRTAYLLGLLFFPFVVMPIYYFRFVRKHESII
jgi:signal transduction histidine kinase